ncbi:MAG: hypothetical protein Q8N18_25860 [Opitutaceae bacterium]|nr:hypothetical protein [Opitutaceae bacterium]
MKVLPAILTLLLIGSLTGCQTAESKRKKDVALSWEKWATVDMEVVGYERGAPDSFLAVTWGSLCAQMYPSNVSKVKVLPPSEFAGQEYSVSIPDSPVQGFDPGPWRESGRRFHVTLSLVYLKYRPWGFIPYDSIKEPNRVAGGN